MKGLRVVLIVGITAFIMGFGLALLSAYLETHGEHAIPQTTRLTMIIGMSGLVASIAAARGANRRVSRAAATEEADAKRCAPVADRATVYVFRDAFAGKVAGLDVLLDGTPIGQTRGKTFYRLHLPPGEHLLTSRNPQNGSQHEHRIRADAGSLLFLEQKVSIGMMSLRHEIVPAEQTSAPARIQRCRLLTSAPSAS
jgi:hypothetical protein